jgi:hypothetical protein
MMPMARSLRWAGGTAMRGRRTHRAGVEGGDLVVVAVGDDVALRGVAARRGRSARHRRPSPARAPGSRRRRCPARPSPPAGRPGPAGCRRCCRRSRRTRAAAWAPGRTRSGCAPARAGSGRQSAREVVMVSNARDPQIRRAWKLQGKGDGCAVRGRRVRWCSRQWPRWRQPAGWFAGPAHAPRPAWLAWRPVPRAARPCARSGDPGCR